MKLAVVTGYLTKDVYLSKTRNGKDVGYFDIASHSNSNQKASFLPCVMYNRFAKMQANNIGKGSHVLLDGNIETYPTTDKRISGPNNKVTRFHIIVNNIEYLDNVSDSHSSSQPKENYSNLNNDLQSASKQAASTQDTPF